MKIKYIFAISILLLTASCKERSLAPLVEDATAPKPVTGLQVENLPGGAKITYTPPDSKNLLYVKAVVEASEGDFREVKSSVYGNELLIEGLSDTKEREVNIYSVNYGEVSSEPVIVTIKPLTPPVRTAFASLTLEADFGGAVATFKNESGANLIYTILVKDEFGEWSDALSEVLYSKANHGYVAKAGLEAQPTDFGVFVRDRWNNHSDTLFKTLTPIFEQLLDKTKYRKGINGVVLPGDWDKFYSSAFIFENLFDDNLRDASGLMHTTTNAGETCSFTVDLGVTTKLSRFKYWQRGITDHPDQLYNNANPNKWELWGSDNPNPDGSFDSSWKLLMTCEVKKPSGEGGEVTADDRTVAAAGHEFRFPADAPPVRYIRWKNISNFGNFSYVNMLELTFWGQ